MHSEIGVASLVGVEFCGIAIEMPSVNNVFFSLSQRSEWRGGTQGNSSSSCQPECASFKPTAVHNRRWRWLLAAGKLLVCERCRPPGEEEHAATVRAHFPSEPGALYSRVRTYYIHGGRRKVLVLKFDHDHKLAHFQFLFLLCLFP